MIFDVYNEIWTDVYEYNEACHVTTHGKFYTIEENADDELQIRLWKGDPYNYTYYTWKSKRYIL